jgi:hypothetical protein
VDNVSVPLDMILSPNFVFIFFSKDEDEEESEEEEEDDTAELLAELQKIKRERAQEAAKKEADRKAEEERIRTENIIKGNPLMADKDKTDFKVKRRLDILHTRVVLEVLSLTLFALVELHYAACTAQRTVNGIVYSM